MKVSLNDTVKVRLTDTGRKILFDNWRALKDAFPTIGEYVPPEEIDGWTKFQLWTLMEDFGIHIHLGCIPPFETEIEIL